MKRAIYVLYFLSLVPEHSKSWGLIWAPLQWISAFLAWNPLKLPMLDLLVLAILLFGSDRAKRQRAGAMTKAIWVSLLALFVWTVWGTINGGNLYQVQFQLHSLVLSYVLALALAKVLVTPNDYLGLGKALFAAAVYRGCTCIAFFADKAMAGVAKPDYCTEHSDSVLFAMGIIAAVAYSIEFRRSLKRKTKLVLMVGIGILLLAIQYNNRRLAWVSLVAGLAVLYFLLPQNSLRKRVNKKLLIAAPILALYVAIGTGRTERIFSPLQALSSVRSTDDNSTKSRDNENAGLLVTLGTRPFMGTGWGHQYIETDSSLSAGNVGFTQYRYLPHNSVLGLLAFTGAFGFACIWMVFPMCAYMLSYTSRRTEMPALRVASVVGVTEVIVVANQWWGDLGLTFPLPGLVMASGIAAAIRLPGLVLQAVEPSSAKGKVISVRSA